eukprot:366269-Chlamydomonas_euryale.AAC.3
MPAAAAAASHLAGTAKPPAARAYDLPIVTGVGLGIGVGAAARMRAHQQAHLHRAGKGLVRACRRVPWGCVAVCRGGLLQSAVKVCSRMPCRLADQVHSNCMQKSLRRVEREANLSFEKQQANTPGVTALRGCDMVADTCGSFMFCWLAYIPKLR